MKTKLMCVFLCLVVSNRVLSLPVNDDSTTINRLPLQSVSAPPSGAAPRDPDAIVYPDQITRDSYGNPVTPFNDLAGAADGIGHMTDINKEKKEETVNSRIDSGFVIPSYAGGITQIEILPPKQNSNRPEFPAVAPSKKTTPEISNDILPPFREDEPKIKYPTVDVNVNTQATIFFPDSNFFNQSGVPSQSHSSTTTPRPKPTQSTTVHHHQDTTRVTPPPTTIVKKPTRPSSNGDVYQGGFGGAAGILGEAQPLGTELVHKQGHHHQHHHDHHHHNQPAAPVVPSAIPPPTFVSAAAPVAPTPTAPITIHGLLDVNLLPPRPPTATEQKPVQVPPVSQQIPSSSHHQLHPTQHHQQTPQHQQQSHQHNGDVYTGSFGGAPGILRPFDNSHQTGALKSTVHTRV